VQTVWGLCVGQSSQGQARSQPNSVGVNGQTRRTVDSSGRRTGAGTVEQVEQVVSESAVVGEGGTVDSPGRRTGARVYGGEFAWREFAVHAKLYGRVVRIRSDARCCRTLAVPFQWYCWCSGGVRQRCLSVP
jgi:hypothetical protein